MELKNQVTSLEISKRLKELGVKQKSLFYWRLGYSTSQKIVPGGGIIREGNFRDYELSYYPKPRYTTANVKWNETDLAKIENTEYSAFTVAELGEILMKEEWDCPERCSEGWEWKHWHEGGMNTTHTITEQPDTRIAEADARGKMLIYLIENKLLPLT